MNPVAVYAFSTILILLPTEKQQKIGFDTVINISAGTAIFQVLDAVCEILPRTRAASENPHTGVATLVPDLTLLWPAAPPGSRPLPVVCGLCAHSNARPFVPNRPRPAENGAPRPKLVFAAMFPLERVVMISTVIAQHLSKLNSTL